VISPSSTARPRHLRLALLAFVIALTGSFSTAPAWATIVHAYKEQLSSLGRPWSLATDSAGDLFVADPPRSVIEEFGPAGEPLPSIGGGTLSEYAQGVAVASSGYVFAADSARDEIFVFKPEGGEYKLVSTWANPALGGGCCYLKIAVDNHPVEPSDGHAGDVLLLQVSESVHTVVVLRPPGDIETPEEPTLVEELSVPGLEEGNDGLAASPITGDVYVASPGARRVAVYNSRGVEEPALAPLGADTTAGSFVPVAVAVDERTGEVYVLDSKHKLVDEFSAGGEYLGRITGSATPGGEFKEPLGVTVGPTGDVYVSDGAAGAVDVFGPDEEGEAAPPPPGEVKTEAVSGFGLTTATVSGSLEHNEGEALFWLFHYAPGVSCRGGQTPKTAFGESETGFLKEQATLEGLEPATKYSVCFGDEDAEGGTRSGAVVPFETARIKPTITGNPSAASETATSVTLSALINPNNQTTECRFEYGPTKAYGTSVPCSEKLNGFGVIEATASVGGLTPGTVYYYRLRASNRTGESEAPLSPTSLVFATEGPPTPVAVGAERVARRSATLTGTLDPDHLRSEYHFEYTTEAAYLKAQEAGGPNPGTNPYIGGDSTHSANAGSGAAFATVAPTSIEQLQPGTTYHFRLVVNNEDGTRYGPDQTFTTAPPLPPIVSEEAVGSVGQTTATITAKINPQGLSTSWELELGTSAEYNGARVYGTLAQGQEAIVVDLEDLAPAITYHYRVIATNEDGPEAGPEQTVTTLGNSSSIVQPLTPPLLGTPSIAFPGEIKEAPKHHPTKLEAALKACHTKHNKKKRKACERQARKRYGARKK
jgi:hypothetical protein